MLGLAWGDVELDKQTVTFTHQLDRQGRRVPLKTRRSRRCLEVTATLTAKLRAHKLASPVSGPHDLVFVTRTGRGHDHRNIGGRVLARAVKRAGLEAVERDGKVLQHAPTFHSLRHTRLRAHRCGLGYRGGFRPTWALKRGNDAAHLRPRLRRRPA